MADNDLRIGDDFVLALNTRAAPNTYTYPFFTEVVCSGDITLNVSRTQIEMPCRGEPRVGSKVGKLRCPLTINFYYSSEAGSTLRTLRDAALAGTLLDIKIVETPNGVLASGIEEWRDHYYVTDHNMTLALEDGAMYTATFEPAADPETMSLGTPGQWIAYVDNASYGTPP